MTRNERIKQKCDVIIGRLRANTQWVSVQVSPGHTCSAPFVTLNPREADKIEQLVAEISRETERKREGGAA